jgi:hypothetical protein
MLTKTMVKISIADLKNHVAQRNGHLVTAGTPIQMIGNVWQLSVAMMGPGALMMEEGTKMLDELHKRSEWFEGGFGDLLMFKFGTAGNWIRDKNGLHILLVVP